LQSELHLSPDIAPSASGVHKHADDLLAGWRKKLSTLPSGTGDIPIDSEVLVRLFLSYVLVRPAA